MDLVCFTTQATDKSDTSATQVKRTQQKWGTSNTSNNSILRSAFWKCLIPMLNVFEKRTTKTELYNGENNIKMLYTRL